MSENKPTYRAYSVREFENNGKTKSAYSKVGAAWAMKSGKGLTVIFDALPLNGKVLLLEPTKKPEKEEAWGQVFG